ncbi:S9 family peptidase [Candidatus Latescibacterota bacterium]
MKKFKKIVKWFLISVLSILIIAAIILSIIGVPKPPTIKAEEVPRIPWTLAKEMYDLINKNLKNTAFNNWTPNENGMLIWANSGGLRSKLHLISDANDQPVKIANLPDNAWGFTVNPANNKNYMIFLLDEEGNEQYQLFRYNFEEHTYIRITDGKSRHSRGSFNKDGTLLTLTSNRRNGIDFDIYTIDPNDSTSLRMIYQAEGIWGPGQWSNNSNHIILRNIISANESKLYLLDINTLERRELFSNNSGKIYYGDAVWGNNDDIFYYLSDFESEFKQLHELNLITGTDSVLTSGINWDVINLEISADTKWLAFTVNEDGLNRLYTMNCQTRQILAVPNIPVGSVGHMRMHPKKNLLALNHTSPFSLTNILTLDMHTNQIFEWTKKAEADPSLPPPQTIHYATFDLVDGKPRTITAYVLRPPDRFTELSPVWIDIHGGPESQANPIMDPMHELARKRGITIIIPNVRGSAGYGKSFLKLDNGYLRENSVKDIGALLDWISSQSEFNKERIAVYGGSYGGYMVLASAVHYSNRLRCGADLFGISNYVTFLENIPEYGRDLRRAEYGDERIVEMRQFLESISPLNNTEKINIPLFIYQGKNDPNVPLSESRQIVKKIREAGKEVWYIEASNEGHGLTQPLNTIYVGAAGLIFLEKYLMN